jgi:protein-S-isoprenylcysteine O-methyltransferase Ste14
MTTVDADFRNAAIALVALLIVVGAYHRIRSQLSGESLDRTREGWPLLIGIRLAGLAGAVMVVMVLRDTIGSWAYLHIPVSVRWFGIAGLAASVAWLIWMFVSLGRNLTDTVVTRRAAVLVEVGPYRFVRNPMYTGLLTMGVSLGVALGTWVITAAFSVLFVLLALRTTREEQHLIARFGDQYRDYMNRVGRFLPRTG